VVIALVTLLLAIGIAVIQRSGSRQPRLDGETAAEKQAGPRIINTAAATTAARKLESGAETSPDNEPQNESERPAAADAKATEAAESKQRTASEQSEAARIASALSEPLVVETSESARPPLPAIGPAALGGEAPSVLDMLDEPADRPQVTADWTSTSMFGVEAQGRKFVYVFDRSGSMGEPANRPLAAAKAELIRSLDRLQSVHQFHLIFYNTEPSVFNPTGVRGRLVFGTDENKEAARRFIESIPADGGTNHYDPLLVAVRLRPDVIFLLTDGEQKDDLSGDDLAHIRRVNDGIAQIQVIQFASTPYSSNSLKRLAEENRGQHTYYDIRKAVER
jgi:hypothetical protein